MWVQVTERAVLPPLGQEVRAQSQNNGNGDRHIQCGHCNAGSMQSSRERERERDAWLGTASLWIIRSLQRDPSVIETESVEAVSSVHLFAVGWGCDPVQFKLGAALLSVSVKNQSNQFGYSSLSV